MTTAERALRAVRRRSRPGAVSALGVDVHLHPEALPGIAAVGRWRTQFETGTSNGGLTAVPGGDRWRWESRLFDGAYDGAPAEERPVYGGLRVGDDPFGSAPRFGSAFLRLRAAVLARTTLCYPDSAFEPEAVGTVDAAADVLAAMRAIRLEDPLDRYVEAHVHGGLGLADVEAIVLDPSHRGSAVEEGAAALGVPIEWHPGYVLRRYRLAGTETYRGPAVTAAAAEVMEADVLTPAVLGAARASGALDPDTAKRVWHVLARFGRAVSGGSAGPA